MLPSKTFFIHATLILLVAAVWFVVTEQKKSTLAFDGELLAVNQAPQETDLTEEDIDKLIDQVLEELSRESELSNRASQPTALLEDTTSTALITSDDLTLLYTPTEEEIREYGLQIGAIIEELFRERAEDEVATFYRMIEEGNGELAGVLAKRERTYTAAALAMKDIPTPTSAAITHIFMANILLDLGEALTQMQKAFENLDGALTAGRFFEIRMEALANNFQTLNNYFLSRGIVFGDNEQVSITVFETNES